jgi:hypothetical protein
MWYDLTIKEATMSNGFLVTFPSSRGEPCFLVTPERVGQVADHRYPWSRATFIATVWATQAAAQDALDQMRRIHAYTAPEVNGGLTRRLGQARVVPTDGVTGVEFEIL